MTRALVVYESMFGNTKLIAEAVADALSTKAKVDLREVSVAPVRIGADVDLLVVGGPTHAFGLSSTSTRRSAAQQTTGPMMSTGIGLREWLDWVLIDDAPEGHRLEAAAFDTRVRHPRVPGSAAKRVQKRLRRLGRHIVVPTETFYVDGSLGPLMDGEQARAREWGSRISSKLMTGSVVQRVESPL